MTRAIRTTLAAIAICATCATALAQRGGSDDGFDFVTVGAPGNAPAWVRTNGVGSFVNIGRVERAFRVTRIEVTRGQWVEFIDAYRPYIAIGDYSDPQFTGEAAVFGGVGSDGLPTYQVLSPQFNNIPTTPSWEYAARYMNWLHNGKKPFGEAVLSDFERGAYDITQFGSDFMVREEGARFFMLDQDEWTKAVYYDPDRFGEGQGGYWRYPDQSDTPLIPGAPGVGETSGSWDYVGAGATHPDVGAYGIETPWGLLDASGGVSEWLETWGAETPFYGGMASVRPLVGSQIELAFSLMYDELGYTATAGPRTSLYGFRVATVVPCADANGDKVINFADLNAVLAGFGQSSEAIVGDVNGDGSVDFDDLNEVLAAFGTACE